MRTPKDANVQNSNEIIKIVSFDRKEITWREREAKCTLLCEKVKAVLRHGLVKRGLSLFEVGEEFGDCLGLNARSAHCVCAKCAPLLK